MSSVSSLSLSLCVDEIAVGKLGNTRKWSLAWCDAFGVGFSLSHWFLASHEAKDYTTHKYIVQQLDILRDYCKYGTYLLGENIYIYIYIVLFGPMPKCDMRCDSTHKQTTRCFNHCVALRHFSSAILSLSFAQLRCFGGRGGCLGTVRPMSSSDIQLTQTRSSQYDAISEFVLLNILT